MRSIIVFDCRHTSETSEEADIIIKYKLIIDKYKYIIIKCKDIYSMYITLWKTALMKVLS